MMEYWNIATARIKSGKNILVLFFPFNPSFHYSIIPIFQVGRNSWFRREGGYDV
jgi:hypothetical protein